MAQDYSTIDDPYNNFLERETKGFGLLANPLAPVDDTNTPVTNPGDIDPGSVSGQSFTDIFVENWIKSRSWQPKKRGFYIDGRTGYAEFSDIFATGNITATSISVSSGSIGGFDIGSDYIRDTANSFGLASTVSGANDVRFWAGDSFNNRGSAEFRVYENGDVTAASITITGGSATSMSIASIPNSTATDLSLLTLTHNLIFSASDLDTVAWTSGTITFSNGRTFAIDAGNTGNMAARTYIYLDTAVSSIVLQTTTSPTTAHGANKVTLAVAVNSTDKAEFLTYHGTGTRNILVDNIATNSASTNEFVANTAQIKDAIITTAKIVSLAVDKLTAGTITSKTISLAVSDGTGDAFIAGGKTDFGQDATSGFIIGFDDSVVGNPVKFEIGSSATKILKYDGTDLTLTGGVITGGTIRTASSGARIELSGATNQLILYNSSGNAQITFGDVGSGSATASIDIRNVSKLGLLIQDNDVDLADGDYLLKVATTRSGSTNATYFSHAGDGFAFQFVNSGSNRTFDINQSNAANTQDVFTISNSGSGAGIKSTGYLAISNNAIANAATDYIHLGAADVSAGNTTLAFRTEGTGAVLTSQSDIASTVRLKVVVNGTIITLLAE